MVEKHGAGEGNRVLHCTVMYYREIAKLRLDKKKGDFNEIYQRLRRLKVETLYRIEDKILVQTDKSDTNETMSETIENSVVVDWLNCIDDKLFFHVCKVLDAELQSVPLFTLQHKVVENIEKYLKVIKKQNIEDILDGAAKPGASNTDIEFLPPTLWTSILSYLDTPDLTNIVLSFKFLSSVGSNPDLAWREMTIKSRAVLLFGLEHFLGISRFRHVETIDFSFVQLDTFELTSLCNFCLNNPVKNLNLSDKIFLELDNELVSESLSSIHTLKVRYSTFSNDQINMILKKTCQQKKLKVLDFLGAKIVGRVGFKIFHSF